MKACRNRNPSFLDRLAFAFGIERELHAWRYFNRQHEQMIYFCRECECGALELRSAGPMGDGQWRDVDSPWKWQWEREQFLQSVRVEEAA